MKIFIVLIAICCLTGGCTIFDDKTKDCNRPMPEGYWVVQNASGKYGIAKNDIANTVSYLSNFRTAGYAWLYESDRFVSEKDSCVAKYHFFQFVWERQKSQFLNQ